MTDKTIAMTHEIDGTVLEQVVIQGDLEKLTPEMRVTYYRNVCDSLGLNPFTKPFDYIRLNNKLTLYAKKDATDQLRASRGVSVRITSRERMDDLYVVTAEATDRTGRVDSEIGAVSIGGLKGDNLANAMMKAVTKAKRRVTLSIVGLGWLDETEIETIRDAQPAPQFTAELDVDDDGVIVERQQQSSSAGAFALITEGQRKRIFAAAEEHGWANDEVKRLLYETFEKESTKELTIDEASRFISILEQGGVNQPALT